MALSDVTATTAPAAEETKKNDASIQSETFRNNGRAIRGKMSEDQKAAEGSKSDTVAFRAALGNPAKPQNRQASGNSIPSLTVVGYEFVATEDVTVNIFPLKDGFHSLTEVDYGSGETKTFKAGEVFALNAMETADFISRPEYAGKFSGEGKVVTLSAKFSADRNDPLPILKSETGSIKEVMIPVAEKVDDKWVVKAQYADKYAVMFKRRSASPVAKAATAGEAEKNIAAAFRQFIDSKKN